MLRQSAERTGDRVGDGTTTSTLLTFEIYAEGVKNIAADASGIDLRRGLQRGLRGVAVRRHQGAGAAGCPRQQSRGSGPHLRRCEGARTLCWPKRRSPKRVRRTRGDSRRPKSREAAGTWAARISIDGGTS